MSPQRRVLYLIGITFTFAACDVSMSAPPNVVLILTDNQGYHELGCHDHAFVRTPNIDAFARGSVDFTNFHAPAYCSPSRGALLTGRHPLRLGIHNTIGGVSILHRAETTLADQLNQAGYRTAIFGKWHLGMSYPHLPLDRGFNESFIHGGGGIGQMEDYFGNNHINATFWHNNKPVPSEGFSTDVLFQQASKFVQANRDQPFFCFVSTPATHRPWQAHPQVAKRIRSRGKKVEHLDLLSMIENIDDNVGTLLKQLDDLGLRENTLVIIATDQGMSSRGANPDSQDHPPSPASDQRHHVFCMMSYPPITRQACRNDALVGMIDLHPTILDLCGIELPTNLDGRSLAPLLSGEDRWSDDRHLIMQCPRSRTRTKWGNGVLKTQRWRLVGGQKLFDLENDGAEVAAHHPQVVRQLRRIYDDFWDSLPAPQHVLSRHPIGSHRTRLSGMDWYQGGSPWNRGHMGRESSGVWAVEVVEKGLYRFELRRFPREASKAIGALRASLFIGEKNGNVQIPPDADHAVIELNLSPGTYDLDASFNDSDSQWSPYFVYVTKVN